MSLLGTVGSFLLSEWLWSVTFAWSYAGFNFMTSCLFIRYILNFTWLRACVLALLVNSFSWFVYWMVVGYLFVHYLQWWAVSENYTMVVEPLWANGYLAMIHAFLHIVFFYGVSIYYGLSMNRLLLVAVLGNGLAALLSYSYITVVFKYSL